MPQNQGPWSIIINKIRYDDWPRPTISGSEIKQKAGSPADWVVNQMVDRSGNDPEIGNDQHVDLTPGPIEKFITRKPATTPGRA